MFETLTDIFLTSPLNFCCIGSPPQSPDLTPRVVVSPPPPPSLHQRTSIALPGRFCVRGPFAVQKTSIDDVAERPVVRPGRSMERAVITPEPPGDEEEGEEEEGVVATQKILVQDLKTAEKDTTPAAEETPEIPAAKQDIAAAAAAAATVPNKDTVSTPNKNDVTLSITKISHHNHQRHDSFASVKSAISFTTIRTKHKHSRQLSTESVSSVLGEEMKRGYVRAIWLLEGGAGGGEIGGER
ncbi:hypothetical protein BDD12DRAFT_870856 [Trichophaea hybrida]|nr:hypothetical protein BDD12DRAFT_870856 [Trichophaea hybrida]